ncbi:helix-turn-helix domain-containing protein [Agrobacterium sp. ST15.13.015]|uniref:helix-turn-helix domain-containing protein n=1 Tax=Agrobacterium sp. ST15.13.015 TaxID=3017319 RepID=UPI0022BBEC5C|nr:helix-turn-helix domain-containing protein [Agrobacterium sp. ST15.13.015]MCZ7502990.1 helix-turn-helix domain-containing protein [Rhizobium rhizogenes]
MFQQIGAVQAKSGTKRTGAPVRRNSRLKGKCEAVFWKPMPRHEAREIMLAARKYELAMKQPGKRTGPLGHVALEVLDYLTNLVDFGNGRLDPSISTIMEKIGRARAAVCRALDALRTHGFVDWLRRYIPTGNDGAGPQVQQTSNAYRLSLPARAKALLGKYARKAAPLPDDALQAQQERQDALKAHMDSLSPADRLRETVEDRARAEQLAGYVERAAQNRAQRAEEGRQTPAAKQMQFHYTQPATANPAIERFRKNLEARKAGKLLNEREFTERTESGPDFYNPAD